MEALLTWISQQSGTLIVGAIGMILLTVLLLPLALRAAGLTGQQIIDVLRLTSEFFLALIDEIRSNNKVARP